MDDGGFSAKDIYVECCNKALAESLLYSVILTEEFGYKDLQDVVKLIASEYKRTGCLPDDVEDRILNTLEKEIDNDERLKTMAKYDEDFAKLSKQSSLKALDTFRKIFDMYNGDSDSIFRFIVYCKTLQRKKKVLSEKKMQMNSERMAKIYKEYPDAAFAFIKDQYTHIFENLWKTCAYEYVNIIGRYPGVGKEESGILIEDIMCAARCYDYNEEYKCDLREIRNSFAHDFYEYDEKMTIKIRDKSRLVLEFRQMMSLVHLMEYKCTYINMIMPMMTLCELAKMKDSF